MTAAAGRHFYICILLIQALFCSFANRSSYPDRTEGEDAEMDEEELPDDKTLEYDEETLELTLPSGNVMHPKPSAVYHGLQHAGRPVDEFLSQHAGLSMSAARRFDPD